MVTFLKIRVYRKLSRFGTSDPLVPNQIPGLVETY
jgi:hypothetical protein